MAGKVLTKPRESRAAHYADHYRQRWGSSNWRSKVHARARAAGMSCYSVWPAIQARFNNLKIHNSLESKEVPLFWIRPDDGDTAPTRTVSCSFPCTNISVWHNEPPIAHIFYQHCVTPTCCSPQRALFRDCSSTEDEQNVQLNFNSVVRNSDPNFWNFGTNP